MPDALASDDQRFTAKGRATRERIIKTAAELILADGLSAMNIDTVRKLASVSGSQIAHYFADKRELLRAVIAHQIEVILDFHRQPKLGGLDTFDDFERWIRLNMRYLSRIGYSGTPTYHALVGQLAKSDDATRAALAAGYWQWVDLLEESIQRMKDNSLLVANADPRQLAMVIVSAHQGGGTMTFAYQQEWPHADAIRFAVNYLRLFAVDPDERAPRPPRRRTPASGNDAVSDQTTSRLTRKGMATRARIIDNAAKLMFTLGVAGTSIDEVRRSAAVSGSQISHYFTDKRDLARQVIAARRNDVKDFHSQPRFGALDTFDALQAWADACLDDLPTVYCVGGCVYGSLVGELIEADDDTRDDLADGYDEWLAMFRAGLTAMRQRGDLRPDADPRHLAVALVVAHQGGAMLSHTTCSPEPMRAALHAAVAYVRSFAPPTASPKNVRAQLNSRHRSRH